MSNVIIKNERDLMQQKLRSIDNNRVFLPSNVTKKQAYKLNNLLKRTQMTFYADNTGLELNGISYNGINISAPRAIMPASKMTLAKTYVVTMAKTFAVKAESFYHKVVEKKVPESPVFSITKELNLQEALKLQQEAIQEATTELNLDELNEALNQMKKMPADNLNNETQVLANNPHGETIIEEPITQITVNKEEQTLEEPKQVMETPQTANVEEAQINVNTKKLAKKRGNVLVVPIVVIWLGIVLFGTIKLVTMIMT